MRTSLHANNGDYNRPLKFFFRRGQPLCPGIEFPDPLTYTALDHRAEYAKNCQSKLQLTWWTKATSSSMPDLTHSKQRSRLIDVHVSDVRPGRSNPSICITTSRLSNVFQRTLTHVLSCCWFPSLRHYIRFLAMQRSAIVIKYRLLSVGVVCNASVLS